MQEDVRRVVQETIDIEDYSTKVEQWPRSAASEIRRLA
jgi:hypothetical protein